MIALDLGVRVLLAAVTVALIIVLPRLLWDVLTLPDCDPEDDW